MAAQDPTGASSVEADDVTAEVEDPAAAAAGDPVPADGEAGADGPGASVPADGADDLDDPVALANHQRDEYLALAQRVQAEFENFKKQAAKRSADAVEQANARLAEALLPILDACDAAASHGSEDVKPIHSALIDVLVKEGLTVVSQPDEAFDPNVHEAVMHEPAEGDGGPTVTEVLRTGYTWRGRTLRPAMVKVQG